MIKIGQPASTQTEFFDKWVGYTNATIVAICPTATEIEKLGFTKPEQEPVYISEDAETKVQQARIEFWFKFMIGEDAKYVRKSVFLKKQSAKTRDGLRTKIIDKYGNTCWLNKEQYEGHTQPDYGRLLGDDWRVAYQGEEELTDIVRNWLNIPISHKWDNNSKKFVPKDGSDLAEAELKIETISDFFKGKFKELKDFVKEAVDFQLLILLAIRNKDGKEYQDIYHKTLKSYQTTNTWVNMIEKETNAGYLHDMTLIVAPVMKYENTPIQATVTNTVTPATVSVMPTPAAAPDFSSNNNDDLPF